MKIDLIPMDEKAKGYPGSILLYNELWGEAFDDFQLGWWDEDVNQWIFTSELIIPPEGAPDLEDELEDEYYIPNEQWQPTHYAVLVPPK